MPSVSHSLPSEFSRSQRSQFSHDSRDTITRSSRDNRDEIARFSRDSRDEIASLPPPPSQSYDNLDELLSVPPHPPELLQEGFHEDESSSPSQEKTIPKFACGLQANAPKESLRRNGVGLSKRMQADRLDNIPEEEILHHEGLAPSSPFTSDEPLHERGSIVAPKGDDTYDENDYHLSVDWAASQFEDMHSQPRLSTEPGRLGSHEEPPPFETFGMLLCDLVPKQPVATTTVIPPEEPHISYQPWTPWQAFDDGATREARPVDPDGVSSAEVTVAGIPATGIPAVKEGDDLEDSHNSVENSSGRNRGETFSTLIYKHWTTHSKSFGVSSHATLDHKKSSISQRIVGVMARAGLRAGSFRVSDIQETSHELVKHGKANSRFKWLLMHCRQFLISQIGITLLCLVCGLAFMCGLSGFLWDESGAVVSEGAFGLITQTVRAGPMDWHHFVRATQLAIARLRVMENNTTNFIDHGLMWYRLEIVYSNTGGFLDSASALSRVHEIESQLRGLAGWQRLCQEAPEEDQHFCLAGDSITAVLFGTPRDSTPALESEGVLGSIDFDGGGYAQIPLLRTYLKNFHSSFLERWFANSDADSPLRSTFAFHLRNASLPAWIDFLEEELQPALKEVALLGEPSGGAFSGGSPSDYNDATKVRVFYRGDYLRNDEFQEAVWADNDWRAWPPISVFLATLLMTRRVILALVAFALSLSAPIIATVVVSTRENDNVEFPVIAVATWFVVGSSCADLAIACESGWTFSKMFKLRRLPKKIGGKRWDCYRRLILFINDVPIPLLPSAGMLLIAGTNNDLPLVQEFSLHAGAGLIFAVLFAVLLFPPALEFGDAIHAKSTTSPACLSIRTLMCYHTAHECGKPPSWWKGCSKTLRVIVDAFQSGVVRVMTAVVVLTLFLGATVPDSTPNYTGKVPELFHEGHRLRAGPKLWAAFGSGELHRQSEAPLHTLRGTNICKPDALDKHECAWFQCEANNKQYPQHGYCSCHYSSAAANSDLKPTCGAVARFMNLTFGTHDDFTKTTFWEWVDEAIRRKGLNISIGNLTKRTTQIMGPLEMEDWQTGLISLEPQMSATITDGDGKLPQFEEACLRIICYCGVNQCRLDDGTQAWASLGNTPSPLYRRLAVTPQHSVATAEVFIVLGLLQPEEVLDKSAYVEFDFGAGFDASDPWTQRGILATCMGTPPDLRIVSRQCWIVDFRSWLHSRGRTFPVTSTDFYYLFSVFISHATHRSIEMEYPDSITKIGYNYFWLGTDGTVKGCYLSFEVSLLADAEVEAYRVLWDTYVQKRMGKFPSLSVAWVTSSIFADYEAGQAVKDAASTMLKDAYLFCILATLIRTWSVGLTIAVTIALTMCFGALVFIAVVIGKQDFGAIELIGLCTFTMNLLPALVRISYQYSVTRDGPGDKPLDLDTLAIGSREMGRRSTNSNDSCSSAYSIFKMFTATPSNQVYLVDNSMLKAGTSGLGYRMSPRLDDIDTKNSDFKKLAPWGSTVVGARYGQNWVRVGDRFLPLRFGGVIVLKLQDKEESDESDDDSCELVGWYPRTRMERLTDVFNVSIEHYFRDVIMPRDHRVLWVGCCQKERCRRLVTSLRRDSRVILGAAISGVITGSAMIPLRMEALSQIGLACLCVSLTLPPVALCLLPILILLRLGPTRSRRRAMYTFVQWFREGCPRSLSQLQQESPEKSTMAVGCNEGEVAAFELGFPFSLAVRTFMDHIPMPVRSFGQDVRNLRDPMRQFANDLPSLAQFAFGRHQRLPVEAVKKKVKTPPLRSLGSVAREHSSLPPINTF